MVEIHIQNDMRRFYSKNCVLTNFKSIRFLFLVVTIVFAYEAESAFIVQPTSKSVCTGTKTNFSFKDTISTGKTYNWQRKVSGKWINLSNTGVFNGINKDTLTINPATDSLNSALFRCTISAASGAKYF